MSPSSCYSANDSRDTRAEVRDVSEQHIRRKKHSFIENRRQGYPFYLSSRFRFKNWIKLIFFLIIFFRLEILNYTFLEASIHLLRDSVIRPLRIFKKVIMVQR